MDVAKNIHQNHGIVLLSRCFVDVDHGVHIEVHTFLFISLFDVDVLNGIVNLQFEYYIFGLIGRVVLVDGHPPSTIHQSLLFSFSKLSRARFYVVSFAAVIRVVT